MLLTDLFSSALKERWGAMDKAGQTMRKSGFDKKMQDSILNEMKSGDYINLLKTFEKYLGSAYTLQTSNPEYLDAFMVEKSA